MPLLYPQVDIEAPNRTDHGRWLGWVESRLRLLILALEQPPSMQSYPLVDFFSNPSAPYSTSYFIALVFGPDVTNYDVTPAVQEFVMKVGTGVGVCVDSRARASCVVWCAAGRTGEWVGPAAGRHGGEHPPRATLPAALLLLRQGVVASKRPVARELWLGPLEASRRARCRHCPSTQASSVLRSLEGRSRASSRTCTEAGCTTGGELEQRPSRPRPRGDGRTSSPCLLTCPCSSEHAASYSPDATQAPHSRHGDARSYHHQPDQAKFPNLTYKAHADESF